MNLITFNIKAVIRDSIFLAMVIQDTTNAFMPSCEFLTFSKAFTLCASRESSCTVCVGHAHKFFVPCYCSACGGSDLATPPSENPESAPNKREDIFGPPCPRHLLAKRNHCCKTMQWSVHCVQKYRLCICLASTRGDSYSAYVGVTRLSFKICFRAEALP
jgi:hypothetical protein